MPKKLQCQQWVLILTFLFVMMTSMYDSSGLGSLLPLLQNEFNLSDSGAATLKTFSALGDGASFATMWLFGDFLPKKPTFLLSISLWILLSFASVLVNAQQFWLFILLRSLASAFSQVFRILVTVLLAEHLTGRHLTTALNINIVGESFAQLLSASINSIFVANNTSWRIAAIAGPSLSIPLVISASFALKCSSRVSMPHPISVLSNALGVLRIPSYVLLALSQCLALFYSFTLFFWMPSLMLYAFESKPDVYLGLSYPSASTLVAIVIFMGAIAAAFIVPFLGQAFQSGMFCFPRTMLAIPLVYLFCSVLETTSYMAQITMITRNFPVFLVAFFIDGIAANGIALNNLQIILATTPASRRASALSLLKLFMAIGNTPAAQIIGAISDNFRGDSTSPVDHLEALQKTFLYTWAMPLASTLLCLVILRFYKRDVEKAKQVDRKNQEETTPLIDERKLSAF